MGNTTQSPLAAKPLLLMKRTILPNLEFLALKYAIMEHFKEYLLYQPFLVRAENNPLIYIMTTPKLDATVHQWVGALAKFNFWLEYKKGQDNLVADVLS